MLVRARLAFTGCCHVVGCCLLVVRMNYSRVLFSSRTICSDPSETKSDMMRSFISSSAAKFTLFQVVVAGDDLDVDVLGDRGEGDLEAADGRSVPSWLDFGKPASSVGRILIMGLI